jgi:hypothetical protein
MLLRARRLSFVLVTVGVLLSWITGCSGSNTSRNLASENAALRDKATQLEQKLAELQLELDRLRAETAESRYADAMLLADVDPAGSVTKLEAIVAQYPTHPLAVEAKKQIPTLRDMAEKKAVEEERKKQQAEEAKKPPLLIDRVWISYNSIGHPEINVRVRNVSRKSIDAFEVMFSLYDAYDRPAKHYLNETNQYGGIFQKSTIGPGATKEVTWTPYGYDLTAKAEARLDSVHFSDNTAWRP